jgi:hypothetical protein
VDREPCSVASSVSVFPSSEGNRPIAAILSRARVASGLADILAVSLANFTISVLIMFSLLDCGYRTAYAD